jgi:hypothetical protein
VVLDLLALGLQSKEISDLRTHEIININKYK